MIRNVIMLKKWISTLVLFTLVIGANFPGLFFETDEAVASSYNDLAQLPIMGWSSWSSIRKNPTEKNIKTAADILAAKFKAHGYEYVNLDDYYQLDWTTKVDKYGRWVVDTKKFPHGMKALGDYIHGKGLKFGLYVTTGIPKGAIDQNTPIKGTPYHAKDIVDLSKGQKVNFNYDNMFAIDYSKPGAQEYIDSWAKLFASYGVDYLKIDGVRNEDAPDIKAWAKALQETGRPIHVELSNNLDIMTIDTWKDLSNGWRTDHDVESYGKPSITDWEHVSRRFSHAAKWQQHAGPGGWNDFDSLNVANGTKDGLTKAEKRSYVSLWAIAASHFMIGSDLTKLDDYGVSLLTNDEIIGADQSGVAGKRLYKTAETQVFYQKLPDGSFNIGLFNTGAAKHNVTVKWADLNIEGLAAVHDMWSHQDLGNVESEFTAGIAAHDAMMIHIIPASSLITSPKSGASGINPSLVKLTWNANPGAGSYHVQVAKDSALTKILYDQTVPSTSLDIKGLEKNTQYYWKVSALSDGQQKPIGIYSFITKMTTVPSGPDWVMTNKNKDDSIAVAWNPSAGAKSYTIYRKKANIFGIGGYTPIASNLKDASFVDKTAARHKGAHYSYFVTASNEIGESEKAFNNPSGQTAGLSVFPFLLSLTMFACAIFFKIIRHNTIGVRPPAQ